MSGLSVRLVFLSIFSHWFVNYLISILITFRSFNFKYYIQYYPFTQFYHYRLIIITFCFFQLSSSTAVCTPCPPNTDGCSGGIITVSPGYWRLSPLTTDMLTCPFPNACVGGNGTGAGTSISTGTSISSNRRLSVALDVTSGCAVGYEGPLCGVCSSNHYFDNTRKTCRSCDGQGQTQIALSITVPMVILSLVLAAFLLTFDFSKMANTELANTLSGADIETNTIVSGPSGMGGRLPDVNMGELASQAREALRENEKEGEDGDDQRNLRPSSPTSTTPTTSTPQQKETKSTNGCVARFWFILDVSKIMSKIKIVVTSYQIVSALPFSLALSFPSVTDVVFHMLSFVNVSAIAFGSPACYLSFDYYDRLRISTIVPLVVFGVIMFVFFPVHYLYYRWYGKDISDLIRRYVFCILFLAYLFLPSVTVTIFGAYSCTNIDPQGLVPGTPTYLRNDYSISCDSKRYTQMVAWANAMVNQNNILFLYKSLFHPRTALFFTRSLTHLLLFTPSHPPYSLRYLYNL